MKESKPKLLGLGKNNPKVRGPREKKVFSSLTVFCVGS